MYNSKYILAGLAVFVLLFTSPLWLNVPYVFSQAGQDGYTRAKIELPKGEGMACIESVEYMRAEHMQLLDSWRDMALREGKREYKAMKDGKVWAVNLQNTCMSCHGGKAQFCDTCHDSNGVNPYCWDCHVEPRGN